MAGPQWGVMQKLLNLDLVIVRVQKKIFLDLDVWFGNNNAGGTAMCSCMQWHPSVSLSLVTDKSRGWEHYILQGLYFDETKFFKALLPINNVLCGNDPLHSVAIHKLLITFRIIFYIAC